MPARQRKQSWVYEEWEALTYFAPQPRLDVEEREKRWQDILGRAFVDGQWTVEASDAALVASSGFYLAWEQKEYALAGERAHILTLHPEYRIDPDLLFYESCSDLAVGNASHALDLFREVQSRPKVNKTLRRKMLIAIQIAFEAAPDKVDQSDVRDFLRTLLPKISKETRRRLASPEAVSLAGLLEIVSNELYCS